jgi:hypothetical protein
MGEATYYGKLVFETVDQAAAVADEFAELCREVCRSDDWWQDHRGEDYRERFWPEYEQLFPKATEYLKSIGAIWDGDNNNPLAGLLEPLGREEDSDSIDVYLNEIRWHSEVWHFADWDPFIMFCKSKFLGCVGGGFVSDEYSDCNYYDMIDWEV